jgi:hypothetical protein
LLNRDELRLVRRAYSNAMIVAKPLVRQFAQWLRREAGDGAVLIS